MTVIIHADFDAFYASVEQRDCPEIKDTPVVVGGKPGTRGVVSSASYSARRCGVRSGMSMKQALRLCPTAVRLSPRLDVYSRISRDMMRLFKDITPVVEPVSLDEAFLDVTKLVSGRQACIRLGKHIKTRVSDEIGLTISVGIAASKAVSKIASAASKPDGLTVILPGEELSFLSQLPVNRLHGIGPKTEIRLHELDIRTIEEMRRQPIQWFDSFFGRPGGRIHALTSGVDDSPVVVGRQRKSLSSETTLTEDTSDPGLLTGLVRRLSHDVGGELRSNNMQGRVVKLKLRLADFTTFSRQKAVPAPIQSGEDVSRIALELLAAEVSHGRVFRLVGVGISSLDICQRSGNGRQLRFAGL